MAEPPDSPRDKLTDRRGFFRETLASLLAPLADLVERRLAEVRDAIQFPVSGLHVVRPPGALPEEEFLETCLCCGRCAAACPAGAIAMLGGNDGAIRPAIIPADQPCVLCEMLACMSACPSGALRPTPRDRIRMGMAAVRPEHCLRTSGQDCCLCLERCPIGGQAISLAEEKPRIASELPAVAVRDVGCVGCGVCEQACPARPRAIVVEPPG